MTPKHIALTNFTGFHANWGCQATSWELLKLLAGCFDDLPHISLIPQLPYCGLDLELENHMEEIYAAIAGVLDNQAAAPIKLRFLERICLRRYGLLADQVRAADCVVCQGEGTMSGSTDFRHGVGLYLLPFVAKHAWGKTVISVNQTIFGRDSKLLQCVTRVLNSFDLVAVRELASLEFANGLSIKCQYIPDAAFLTRPYPDNRLPALQPYKRYFCLTGSALSTPGVDEFIFACADRLRADTGMTPIVAAAKDKSLRQLVSRNWPAGSFLLIDSGVCYPAIAEVLSRCEFLIGGRYHMAIMAAAVGTPSILLRGNTFKNEGLAAALGVRLPLRDVGDVEGVVGDTKALLYDAQRVNAQLKHAMTSIGAELRFGRSALKDFLDRPNHVSESSPRFSRLIKHTHGLLTTELINYYSDAAMNKEAIVQKKAGARRSAAGKQNIVAWPPIEEAKRFLLAAHQDDGVLAQKFLGRLVSVPSQPPSRRLLNRFLAAMGKGDSNYSVG